MLQRCDAICKEVFRSLSNVPASRRYWIGRGSTRPPRKVSFRSGERETASSSIAWRRTTRWLESRFFEGVPYLVIDELTFYSLVAIR